MQTEVLPAATAGVDLGTTLLELGPGPGATTDWLRTQVDRLVAVEHEPPAADALEERFAGTNVEVVHGDATALPFADDTFDSVGAFTMLHHVPTAALQIQLLSEALRVLRPGGVLVGSDSLQSVELHHFHEGDTYNPVEPAAFLTWLRALGFGRIAITIDRAMTFAAHKPVD
jgi:SAM-dependent methyltransferase